MRINKNQIHRIVREEKRRLVEQSGPLELARVINKHYVTPPEPPQEVLDVLESYTDGMAEAWGLQWDPGDPVMRSYGQDAWDMQASDASVQLYDQILAILETPDEAGHIIQRIEEEADYVEEQLHNGEFYRSGGVTY